MITQNPHDRARELIALDGPEDLSREEQNWLRAHTAECLDCRHYQAAVGSLVRAVRGRPMAADSALVESTRIRLRSRALELRRQKERLWLVCMSCLFVALSTAVTTPLCWRFFKWLGSSVGASSVVWQAGFAFFWIVPALVASAVLLARGTHLSSDRDERLR